MDDDVLSSVLDHYDIRHNVSRMGEQPICCPSRDHDDRRASASLNLDKGTWNCHGCGTGGDAIGVVKAAEGVDYQAAKRQLEAITGRSHSTVRGAPRKRTPVPRGTGYQPRYRRELQAGSSRRPTDWS